MALAFYSAATGRLRRRVRVSPGETFSDGDLLKTHFPLGGESVFQGVFIENQEQMNAITGLVPINDRYVGVDTDGVVRHYGIIDPACGDVFGRLELHPHASAGIDWRRIGTSGQPKWQRSINDINEDIANIDLEIEAIHNGPSKTPEIIDAEVAVLQRQIDVLTSEAQDRLRPIP